MVTCNCNMFKSETIKSMNSCVAFIYVNYLPIFMYMENHIICTCIFNKIIIFNFNRYLYICRLETSD